MTKVKKKGRMEGEDIKAVGWEVADVYYATENMY